MANFSCSNSPSTKQSWDCHHGHCHPSQMADQTTIKRCLCSASCYWYHQSSHQWNCSRFLHGEMMVLPPKTYCLWQCWDMATIHPTMEKEWGMSSKNILTVKVKFAGNRTNACNIFLDIQEVNNFEICFKKFEFTPGNPWQALLQVQTDKIYLTLLNEICTEIWIGTFEKCVG